MQIDLNQENSNISLFDNQDDEQISLADTCGKLDIVHVNYIDVKSMTWEDLFDGYDSLYAITYSSGIDFICKLLKKFDTAEIIFGSDDVLSYSMKEIMAFQLKTIERLRDRMTQNKIDLVSRIEDGSLRLLVAQKQLSHEKIYLLQSKDGKKRVIMGSANMSQSAFSGRQRENICYMDDDNAYTWYYSCYEQLRDYSSDDITSKGLAVANDVENIEELPIAQTVIAKKALVIEPQNEVSEDIRFVLDIKKLAGKFSSFMPKADKRGKVHLIPETFKQIRRRLIDANILAKELRNEHPQLEIDLENMTVTLNDSLLDLSPETDAIENDVKLFMEYMHGYDRFHGDVALMQARYYEFACWFFATPFMAKLRNMAIIYNFNLLPYPVFGLIYGQSKAGKQAFLKHY